MPLTVWRIVTHTHLDTAFTGLGARLYGGRWNPPGTALVYTAAHPSLALLEMLVQDTPLRAHYCLVPATLPDDLALETLAESSLPADWRDPAARHALRARGTAWLARKRSVALLVPSAVMPFENNVLLDPQHPDFYRIELGAPLDLTTDTRLIRPVNPRVR